MSYNDIGNLYRDMRKGKKHKGQPKLSDMYHTVLEADYQELLPVVTDEGKPTPKSKITDTAKAIKSRGDDRSVSEIVDDIANDPNRRTRLTPLVSKSPGDDLMFNADDHLPLINALPGPEKAKIFNIISNKSRNELKNMFGSRGIPEKLVMGGVKSLVNSDINIGALVLGLQQDELFYNSGGTEGQELLNVDLLNTPGNYSIDEFFLGEPWIAQTAKHALSELSQLGSGGKQAGPYEAALSLLSKRIDQKGKGDIQVDGNLCELKGESGRIGPEEWPKRQDMIKTVRDSVIHVGTTRGEKWNGVARDLLKQKKSLSYDDMYTFSNDYQLSPEERLILMDPITKALYGRSTNIPYEFSRAGNFETIGNIVAETLFNLYKSEKSSGEGAWDILIGINLHVGPGGISVLREGADLVNAPKYTSSPNIIASGAAAAREYMYAFVPKVG